MKNELGREGVGYANSSGAGLLATIPNTLLRGLPLTSSLTSAAYLM